MDRNVVTTTVNELVEKLFTCTVLMKIMLKNISYQN